MQRNINNNKHTAITEKKTQVPRNHFNDTWLVNFIQGSASPRQVHVYMKFTTCNHGQV